MLSSVQLFFSRFLVCVGYAVGFKAIGVYLPAGDGRLDDPGMRDFAALGFKAPFFDGFVYSLALNPELLCGFGDGEEGFLCGHGFRLRITFRLLLSTLIFPRLRQDVEPFGRQELSEQVSCTVKRPAVQLATIRAIFSRCPAPTSNQRQRLLANRAGASLRNHIS
jgi:hypothetical protein